MIRTGRFSWLLAVQVSELFQALLSQSELYHVCQHYQNNICMPIIKKMKVRWSGHVVRVQGTLANTILQSKVGGKRSRGRPVRQWLYNAKERTKLSLNETWREPDDCVCCGKLVSHVAPTEWPSRFKQKKIFAPSLYCEIQNQHYWSRYTLLYRHRQGNQHSILPNASIMQASRVYASTGITFWKTWREMTPRPASQISTIR